ncbi:hypothetical protein [Novosphingobium sp. 9]|uniref:hypothetical protein n=1 Tax=Novosphingobium sp. 9 TaxID=2025349 RepID=UPI0021B5DC21|nr:hypothetical protein [Novosphingobium sp. 9]
MNRTLPTFRIFRSTAGIRRAFSRLAALGIALVMLGTTGSAIASKGTPPPVPGGPLHTLPLGHYECEMPGDATGAVGKPMNSFDFQVVIGSSYKAQGVRGSYLYTGEKVVMTGGVLKGLAFHRISNGFLRKLNANGSDSDMRCVLSAHVK